MLYFACQVGKATEGDGGNLTLAAGPSLAMSSSGGTASITGGLGLYSSPHDGSDGGAVLMTGGSSVGMSREDNGGDVNITGGKHTSCNNGNDIA